MMLKKELAYREFVQRENKLLRAPYNAELEFYSVIKCGDVEKIKDLCKESLLDRKSVV